MGDVKVGGHLGLSDHEMLDFSILVEPWRESAELPPWTSRGQTSTSLGLWLRGFLGQVVLESVGAQEGWEYFKEVILKVQELTIPTSWKMS